MNSSKNLSVHEGITYVPFRTASTFSLLSAQYPNSWSNGEILKTVPYVLH